MSHLLLDFPLGELVTLWSPFEITLESQLVTDPFFVITAILLVLTIVITVLYYGRIRGVSKAYEEAKNVVGDIVVSFGKQIQSQEEELATTVQKVETLFAKSDRLSKRLDAQNGQFTHFSELASKVAGTSGIETLKSDLGKLKERVEELAKIQDEFRQHAIAISDSQIEAAIPIKKERALAPLTETELRVLEFIAGAGEKTAPEVKDMVQLTREHTARLMKKLYEEGYLERRSEKTPYAYRVKEEMLKILKKSEVKA